MRAQTSRPAWLSIAASTILILSLPLVAVAGNPQSGFKTLQPAMLAVGPDAPAGMEIKPIITVGDSIGAYTYAAVPDGISWYQTEKNTATVFVNHETSTVPFPYPGSSAANDFDNSQVSQLELRNGGAVLSASTIIPSSANYQRFCSNFLGTASTGFSRPILFNNEEGIDWVNDSGPAWTSSPSLEGATGAHQIGAVVAYDVNANAYRTIWGMGRLNHENNVAVPGYGKPVLLSGDDSFNQVAAQSQLYAYLADDANAVWNDTGDLWAFAPNEAFSTINDYFDFPVGSSMSISGKFVKVPKDIATGKDGTGKELMSGDVGYPTPPADGTWQRRPGTTTGPGIDGPQWVLEHWGDQAANNVFQFLRIEDIATDKRPGMSNVVYLADSGRGLRPTDTPPASQGFRSTNGRIWKMVLDPADPTKVLSLSILIEGDDNPVKTPGEIHQPDNLETTLNGLYILEDPGSSQSFTPAQQVSDAARATTARVWQYRFADLAQGVMAKVDQFADEGPTDVDPSGLSRWGDWESTGIVDVSSIFGPGKFLINIQAHTLWIEKSAATGWTNKREGGQMLLITIPGG